MLSFIHFYHWLAEKIEVQIIFQVAMPCAISSVTNICAYMVPKLDGGEPRGLFKDRICFQFQEIKCYMISCHAHVFFFDGGGGAY